MGKYKVLVTSDTSYGRVYETDSQSAFRAAQKYGRCESGEVVTVYRKKTHEILSRVIWESATRQYCNVWKPKYLEEQEG